MLTPSEDQTLQKQPFKDDDKRKRKRRTWPDLARRGEETGVGAGKEGSKNDAATTPTTSYVARGSR